ncbi:NCS2 family permease [Ammoniphilus sp. CFH 90114]|uniref:NCS2 family permease n=1 Tax=Ammoniphilus sp. CFH 90114 TaxID=2493665 RepID=UPI00100EE619|nr:NCS2 family permease [Ammoniphilus sp. CFH 90114]RXT05373.1 NCS2 family permease [Ammoniphilus sp. CFH 90114]
MAGYFEFAKHGTSFRTEFIAGLTTFLAMAYILAVNPFMLSGADLPPDLRHLFPDKDAVFVATALAAVIGTLIMGVYAKYPIALAPGMGLNAFFTFTVVLTMGIPWQQALAGVFISGVIFLILTFTGVRETIINAIPAGLKYAASAGIGLFIAFIGFKNAGIIVADPATFVALGNLHYKEGMEPAQMAQVQSTLLAVFGLVVTVVLMTRKLTGSIFYGMVITAVGGMIVGIIQPPAGVVAPIPSIAPTFGAMFGPLTDLSTMLSAQMIIVIFTFLFVDFFDTAGTLVGVASQAGFMKGNELPRAGKALTADSVATVAGAVLGTSTTTSYVESSAGVAAGGRTGFASVVTAAFFAIALFFSPLLAVITPAVTAPALIVVGILMASNLSRIEWDKIEEAAPAFLTIILMPLTFSIATGIGLGFILYPLTKLIKGEGKQVHPIMYFLFFVFLIYFGWVH